MFEDIKKLRKLLKLQEKSEAQIHSEGFTPEVLKDIIEKQQNKIEKDINGFGWLLMFLIVIPLALTGLGVSVDTAILITYFGGGLIFLFILPKITRRHY